MSRSEAPPRYPLLPLRRLVDIRPSGVNKTIEEHERPIRLCNYVDVYRNRRINADMSFNSGSASDAEIERFALRTGDVLITKDSETPADIAVPALVESAARDLICGYHLALLRPRPAQVHGPFLYYALASDVVRTQFSVRAQGITRFGLTINGIGSVPCPLPPLDAQRAIADFLDRETARIDSLIAKKERQVDGLSARRNALICSAITGGLESPNGEGQLPKASWANDPFADPVPGWRSVKLRHCVTSSKNGTWGGEPGSDDVDITCVRVADFRWRDLSVDLSDPTTRSIPREQASKLRLKRGDLLLEKSGGGEKTPVGRVVEFNADVPAVCSNFVARVRPTSLVTGSYLGRLLAGLYLIGFSHQFIKQNTGIQNLDDAALFDSWVRIPPLHRQSEIVSLLDAESQRLAMLRHSIGVSIEALRELRSALITTAVTGQIDPATWGRRSDTERSVEAAEHAGVAS